MGKQVELLKHHTSILAQVPELLGILVNLDAIDDQPPRIVPLQPVETADQRGFTRPGRTADHHLLTRAHGEIDVLQSVEMAIVLVEMGDPEESQAMYKKGLRLAVSVT